MNNENNPATVTPGQTGTLDRLQDKMNTTPVHHEPNRSHRDRFEKPFEILKPAVVLLRVPKLKHGDDEQRAAELEQYINEAESGLRSILKVGFFLECLAADLKHGQLGPWVESHCKNRAWRTVRRWKQVAAGVGDVVGISLKKRLQYKLHEVLALPNAKVPDELKPIREKIDKEIEGKSYRQLFLQIKQVDDDDDSDNPKPKRGALKGSKGLTKEMRERAAARAEAARLAELEEQTAETAAWLLENADAKNLGMVSEKALRRLADAAETVLGFIKRLEESRKQK